MYLTLNVFFLSLMLSMMTEILNVRKLCALLFVNIMGSSPLSCITGITEALGRSDVITKSHSGE